MRPPNGLLATAILLGAASLATIAHAQSQSPGTPVWDRTRLPLAEPPFTGKIGNTYRDSMAAWPPLPAPPQGAPNVVIILLDDVGIGQVSTFGGPVPTPNSGSCEWESSRPFTGRIERVDIELGPRNLNPEDEARLHKMRTMFAGAHG